MYKMYLLAQVGIMTGDWRSLRYEIAARVWLWGLRLMRWSWRFSPDFDAETNRMLQFDKVTGGLEGFQSQPPLP